MANKIKVTPTKLGSDGTGYYRGSNGRYYYGNAQNGYLTETRQSQQARGAGRQSAAPAYSSQSSGYSADTSAEEAWEMLKYSIIFSILLAKWAAPKAKILLAWGFFITVAVSALIIWPMYINQLAGYYIEGRADLMVIIMSAVVIFLIIYFLLAVCKVLATKKMRSRRYVVVCIIAMTAPAVLVGLFLGQPSLILSFAVNGIVMSLLPAFILSVIEYTVTKGIRGDNEWYIAKIMRLLMPKSKKKKYSR